MKWSDLSEAQQKRLIRNEASNRRETAKRGLPAVPVSAEGLWLISQGMCHCNECRGTVPLDPDTAVIAHVYFRAGKGSPGHVPHNLAIWNEVCNRREARLETSSLAKGKRLEIKKPIDTEPEVDRVKPKLKSKWPKRKFPSKADRERILKGKRR